MAKSEYRDRDETEVAVLDALVNRGEEGMTVLEIRAAVSVEIDALEEALGTLKEDGLIRVEHSSGRAVIRAEDRVVPDEEEPEDEDRTFGEWLRERFRL